MKRTLIASTVVAILAAMPSIGMAATPTAPVASADNTFGFRLLNTLAAKDPGQNVFISPFSIASALSMLMNGAGGATRSDIATTLDLDGISLSQVNDANQALLPSLENPGENVSITIANALWADKRFTFNREFSALCGRAYDARVSTLDFRSPAAADTINGWVKDKTQGLINSIISPADVRGSSDILTNCVYFKGRWQHVFDRGATHDAPFHPLSGDPFTVPMMSQNEGMEYGHTGDSQIGALPYGDGRVSMYILLPKFGTDPATLIKGTGAAQWKGLEASLRRSQVQVELPRFSVTYTAQLKEPLSSLGMASAFRRGADFGPMGLRNEVVGQVIHKTVLQVDEESTVAAAATGITMRPLAMPMRPRTEFRVDHPFFVAIIDNQTGTVLFSGLIYRPS